MILLRAFDAALLLRWRKGRTRSVTSTKKVEEIEEYVDDVEVEHERRENVIVNADSERIVLPVDYHLRVVHQVEAENNSSQECDQGVEHWDLQENGQYLDCDE